MRQVAPWIRRSLWRAFAIAVGLISIVSCIIYATAPEFVHTLENQVRTYFLNEAPVPCLGLDKRPRSICWNKEIHSALKKSVIAAFNGITSSLIQVPILIGLWKFKRLLWWEKTLFFVFPFMPAIMWFSPPEAKDNLFLALTLITLVPACRQPYEMWRAGTRGAVEIKFFGTQLINCAVWMAFAFSIGTWVVILCQSLMTLTVIATVALWCWYRAKEPNPPK